MILPVVEVAPGGCYAAQLDEMKRGGCKEQLGDGVCPNGPPPH
eukprot:COSAG02_NODE_8262_length_2638_cov_9.241140_2_plen_43_part_00